MAKREDSALSDLISERDVQTASASDKTLKSRVETDLDGALSPGSAQADLGSAAASAAAMSLFYAFDRYDTALGEQDGPKSGSTKQTDVAARAAETNPGAMPDRATDAAQPSATTDSAAIQPPGDAEFSSASNRQSEGVGADNAPFAMPQDAAPARTISLEETDSNLAGQPRQGGGGGRTTVSMPQIDGMGGTSVETAPANMDAVGAVSDSDAAANTVLENAANGTIVGVTAFAQDADLDDSVT